MTRILLISGSTRDASLQTSALRTAARFAPKGIIAASLFGGLRELPAYVPGERDQAPAVTDLRRQVAEADAVLFCTPQYAGSMPGSLKNLLDWLIDSGDLRQKPVAWLCVDTAGHDEGARAELEQVLVEHGGARVLRPACIRIPLGEHMIDDFGLVTDPQLHMALLDMLEALSRAMTVPRQTPSWQQMSSVFPLVTPTVSADDWRTQR